MYSRDSLSLNPVGCQNADQPREFGCICKREHSFGTPQGRLAMVWGGEPPAFSVGYVKPTVPRDSGFTVLFDDAPDPEDLETTDVPECELPPGVSLVCLHCLIEEHPEIGRGLDIARKYGVADIDDNREWAVGDLGRLERE